MNTFKFPPTYQRLRNILLRDVQLIRLINPNVIYNHFNWITSLPVSIWISYYSKEIDNLLDIIAVVFKHKHYWSTSLDVKSATKMIQTLVHLIKYEQMKTTQNNKRES